MTLSARAGTIRTRSVRKVALSAALMALLLYVCVGAVADLITISGLSNGINGRLGDRLGDIEREYTASGGQLSSVVEELSDGDDLDDAPVLVWFVPDGSRRATPLEHNALTLPVGDLAVDSVADRTLGGRSFRVAGETVAGGRFIVATSTGSERAAFTTLLVVELVLAPFAFLGVLGLAWLIGRGAADPVERARRQQQAFTADASHELRTPLTVIEAELGLALSKPRDADSYRDTLERVSDESRRLRSLVEELLWLSRLDAAPNRPLDELADLAVIAAGCVDRFRGVATTRATDLGLADGPESVLLRAPADWLDQLGGVLVDNACKYAGPAGIVRVGVSESGRAVSLFVEDSGPGIEEFERERIFDRFHRGAQRELGTGLGLAIGDAVVQATGGTWSVGSSVLGGARFAVTWQQSDQPRRSGLQ